ncbi:MAG: hypothetical protein ACPGRX_00465 [Bdellovibrionales bacterium]
MDFTFDKFEYIEKLKASGVTKAHALAHAEALDAALKEKVATKFDLEILGRDIKIWTGSLALVLFGALVALKFFS